MKEFRVYKAIVEREVKASDMDMCPTTDFEKLLDDMFSTETSAVNAAKLMFEKTDISSFVVSVYAQVRAFSVTEEGIKANEVVLNLFKKK